ncbi:MAG: triose-phosphate isomerase [Azoarcus sp.]|jgi:triosephosphate isomerase|nr:triose-phosphate isomerase [Azoarcus sp.]
MTQKLVVGNWKLNGSLAVNEALLAALGSPGALAGVDVAVCVPFPYLAQAASMLKGPDGVAEVALGAQTVSEFQSGAYTGEVSAKMLADLGCRYVIVGHSERRALFGEDDATVGRKTAAALRAKLTPIVCVGEALDEREAGQAMAVICRQLDAVLACVGLQGLARSVIAYEPVWAIGTGRAASAEQAREAHAGIRRWLAGCGVSTAEIRILYGGSVKADNAAALFGMPGVDGGLIGGASLSADNFMAICQAAVAGGRR